MASFGNAILAQKVKKKVRCVITDVLPNGQRLKLKVKMLKLSDLNEKGFFHINGLGSYHFDTNKFFLLGEPAEILYQKGIAEPLTYNFDEQTKSGHITGHSSEKVDDMMNHRFIQQLIAGMNRAKNQDVMMYVMMAVVGIAGFAIGYIFGNPSLFHSSTTVPKVTSP